MRIGFVVALFGFCIALCWTNCSQGRTCQDNADCLFGEQCKASQCIPAESEPSVDAGPKSEPQVDTGSTVPDESKGEKDSLPENSAESEPEPVVEKKPLPEPKPEKPDPSQCAHVAEKPRPFRLALSGTSKRHDLVGNFQLKLQQGGTWSFGEQWTGCDSYIFIPNTLQVSQLPLSPSVWTRDLEALIKVSPKNVHYFFISRSAASRTSSMLQDMQLRVNKALRQVSPALRQHWQSRLHVVATYAGDLQGWLKNVAMNGVGSRGFAIDRFQRLRGLGSLADVNRFKSSLQAAKKWPFESNISYAANEAVYYNFEARRQARLESEKGVTVVKLWKGQVISQFAEMEVELPSAEEMKKFDTLELDVTQRCPRTNVPEAGNCGAWDYLAHFYVKDKDGKDLELARLITTYHREGRWIVDMTPMLVRLAEGGKRKFKWLWAPRWNKQPTATTLSLRFSNRNKGVRPTQLIPLFKGGKFTEEYNKDRKPMTVPIPGSAKKVQLWAIISGHGNSSAKCAEFCNHQHRFVVNKKVFLQEYKHAGKPDDCMKKVKDGVVPNQWGTWWLGRGGWCPGQQVYPYSPDLTSVVTPGQDAEIHYTGLFKGQTPPKQSKVGNINLQSYLVVYE